MIKVNEKKMFEQAMLCFPSNHYNYLIEFTLKKNNFLHTSNMAVIIRVVLRQQKKITNFIIDTVQNFQNNVINLS